MNVIGPQDEVLMVRHSRPFSLRRLVLMGASYIFQPTVFLRRAAMEVVGELDVSLRHAMDYDLWIRVGKQLPVRYLPRVLANFRIHGDSKTTTEMGIQRKESQMVRRRHTTRSMDRLWFTYYDLRVYLYRHWERHCMRSSKNAIQKS
jgi:hypothetical protein